MDMDVNWDELEKELQPQADDKQEEKSGNVIPEGVDPDTWALAVALKKAKENPAIAQAFAQVAAPQQATGTALTGIPGMQMAGAQPQPPAQSEDAQRLEAVKKEQEEIRRKLMEVEAGSDEYNRLMLRLQELETERIVLEPKVEMERQLSPLREAQINNAITTLLNYAQQRIATDMRLNSLPPEKKQVLLNAVQQGLMMLKQREPDQLLSAEATNMVEVIIRSVYYQVAEPVAPYDGGVNPGNAPGNDIQQQIISAAKDAGVDPKVLAEELKYVMGGGK